MDVINSTGIISFNEYSATLNCHITYVLSGH